MCRQTAKNVISPCPKSPKTQFPSPPLLVTSQTKPATESAPLFCLLSTVLDQSKSWLTIQLQHSLRAQLRLCHSESTRVYPVGQVPPSPPLSRTPFTYLQTCNPGTQPLHHTGTVANSATPELKTVLTLPDLECSCQPPLTWIMMLT